MTAPAGAPILAHGTIIKMGGLPALGTPVHAGGTQDDLTVAGAFSGTWEDDLVVEIDGVATPNTFQWSKDGGSTFVDTAVPCSVAGTALSDNLVATFAVVTGHTLAESWTIPVALATIANRVDIKYKPPAREKVDVTHHDSLDREYIKGFGAGGEVTFPIFYHAKNPTHVALKAAHDADDASAFVIVFKDGTSAAFLAYVMLEGFDLGVANKPQSCDVKLEITGSVSYTEPA